MEAAAVWTSSLVSRDSSFTEMKWLKHAFAIDPPGKAEPNETQRRVVERLCVEIVRRRLTAPALLLLEMSRPLNYVSAQLLHFFQPILTAIANADEYEQFTLLLEQRGSIDYICERIEKLEAECATREKGSVNRHDQA
jgi:hypothetical protein